MSMPFVLDGFLERKDSLTVRFYDDQGRLGEATFGDLDSAEEYRISGIWQCGRTYNGAPDPVITFLLLKRGAPSHTIMQYDDLQGGMRVSHTLSVTTPKDRANALANATSLFMHGTRHFLGLLYRTPKLKAITYEDDAFIISYNYSGTLKLGMTAEHRRQLISYERELMEVDLGLTRMTFRLVDEEGDELSQPFLVPTEQVADIAADLSAFLFKHRQYNPKVIAAPVSSLWPAAA